MTIPALNPRPLDEAAYDAVWIEPMDNVTENAESSLDIWPYVRAVSQSDLAEHEIWNEFVECVYRTADGHFDHVIVCTKTQNVYLAVIVDRNLSMIVGHRLLDMNKIYGLTSKTHDA
jgi:hypothetical protein